MGGIVEVVDDTLVATTGDVDDEVLETEEAGPPDRAELLGFPVSAPLHPTATVERAKETARHRLVERSRLACIVLRASLVSLDIASLRVRGVAKVLLRCDPRPRRWRRLHRSRSARRPRRPDGLRTF